MFLALLSLLPPFAGCIASIVGAFIYIVTFAVLHPLRTFPTLLTMHLCAAIFASNILFLSGITRTANQAACTAIAAMLYYFLLASFTWMLLIGVNIWNMLVKVRTHISVSCGFAY